FQKRCCLRVIGYGRRRAITAENAWNAERPEKRNLILSALFCGRFICRFLLCVLCVYRRVSSFICGWPYLSICWLAARGNHTRVEVRGPTEMFSRAAMR